MTDLDQTAHRLREAIDELVADLPADRSQPESLHPVSILTDHRKWNWQRTVAAVSLAAIAAAVVVALIYVGPRSTPPGSAAHHRTHADTPAAPVGWVNLPDLLPPSDVVIDRATVATGPVPVPTTGTYEQAYQGPQTTNPTELLITTVAAQPGALSSYAANGQSVAVDGTTGYLTSFSDHQLLWQTADGVVVSLESSGMSAADVTAAAQLVDPLPAAQLGVDLSGALPDGLVSVGEGFANDGSAQNLQDGAMFSIGDCHAYTQIWAGTPADFAPMVIVGDATQVVNVRGTKGLLVDFGGSTWALLWSEQPGIDVRLQGSDCDLTTMAASIRIVDAQTWSSTWSALGSKVQFFTPTAPVPPASLPGPGTFGLAH
jgi:hypothetical protein